jgi:acyl-CoA synthetase (AMP-forming)/AMP-acid ligase II/pimeloyl-ACP methyl ester carboxylesterase/acyl carrier protein
VPLNSAAPVAELEQALVETGAKTLLVPTSAPAETRDLARRLGVLLLEYAVEEGAQAGKFHISGGHAAAVTQSGPAAAGDVAFVLRTSGTTSRAKIVPISHRNIVARTAKSRRLFNLSAGDRCLNLMPLCYHHGLNSGLMLPLTAGSAVICPPAFDVETFLACMHDFSPTWYTASFSYHQAILGWLEQRPNVLVGHQLRFSRAGSGPLPARVRVGVEAILGAPLLEVYGTTETGTVAANSPVGPRKPGTVGTSPDNDIAIVDDDGNQLAAGMEGEVVVRGAIVFNGYENDPAANRRVFRGEWYRTGDVGVIDADGFIKLLGRLDDVINRGGEKISPREVDEALLAHEAVAEAVGFPVPHATLHQEIAAAVVPHSGMLVAGDDLRRFLATRLTPFKVPRVILCAAELPKGPTGKVNRKSLAAHFGLGLEAVPSAQVEARTETQKVEPLTETQTTLLGLWRDVLKRQDIGRDDDFFLVGGDSLSAVDLLHRIEETLQFQLPLDILMEAPTVRLLDERLAGTTRLEGRLGGATLQPFNNTIRINTTGTQRPLFAIGGTGGRASYLSPILRSLGPDQPCYGLQPPAMDWSGVGCTTIPEMAAHYIGVVKALQPHGPYRLIGHSFGGRVAYEMALQLQRMDDPVEFLGMLDTYPSTCPEDGGASVSLRPLNKLPVPRNSIEATTFRVIESHWRASRNYNLDNRLDRNLFQGELTYFYCTGEPVVARHDRRRLWQKFAPAGVRLLPLPGMHGWNGQGPQYTVLPVLLHACLNGEPPAVSDPATVFDRTYRIDDRGQRPSIVSSTGEEYPIDENTVQGYVETFTTDAEATRIGGWAVEHCQRQPAQVIAVFLGDRFLGYGASGTPRPDIAQQLSATSAQYAGFDFTFWGGGADGGAIERPRLFVLSADGCAAELRFNAVQEAIALRGKLADGERTRTELEVKYSELAAQIEAMENSTCWRITRPVRQLRHLIARISGR